MATRPRPYDNRTKAWPVPPAEGQATGAIAPRPSGRITDKLFAAQVADLPAAAAKRQPNKMRWVGNGLIIVGVLLMLGVGGYQGYIWWLENSTPDTQTLQGQPTQVYLPVSSNLPATPTPIIVQSAPPPADGSTQASTVPVIDNGKQGSAGASGTVPTLPAARIVISSIKLDSKIVDVGWHTGKDSETGADVAIWDVAEYAVGHNLGSANPGMTGNVVLAGHDDYKGEVFRYLPDVKLGDTVKLYNQEGDEYLYTVTTITKVKEANMPIDQRIKNAAYMNPTPDQTLTMITCWPYAVDSYRWIVIAKPASGIGNLAAGGPQVH